ncbi:MAG: hypothetical protein ACP5H2_07440 [Solirubrobacteraceae bacterium]
MDADESSLDEQQLRAAYEQEIKRVRVEDVLLENVVTVINLGLRRTGLLPGTEDELDLAQVHLAIEAVRALMPQLERVAPEQVDAIRDALSQLQMAYVKAGQGGSTVPEPAPAPEPVSAPAAPVPPANQGGPGPAQRSGRLWVPGQ